MSDMVADSCIPGRAASALLSAPPGSAASPRSSPWFTAVLVHGWYMNVLLDITTVGGLTEMSERSKPRLDPQGSYRREATRLGPSKDTQTCGVGMAMTTLPRA